MSRLFLVHVCSDLFYTSAIRQNNLQTKCRWISVDLAPSRPPDSVEDSGSHVRALEYVASKRGETWRTAYRSCPRSRFLHSFRLESTSVPGGIRKSTERPRRSTPGQPSGTGQILFLGVAPPGVSIDESVPHQSPGGCTPVGVAISRRIGGPEVDFRGTKSRGKSIINPDGLPRQRHHGKGKTPSPKRRMGGVRTFPRESDRMQRT